MASKIQSHNFYVAITPYKVEDSSADEFNLLNVRTAYDDLRKYFYVDLHAGRNTGWGGFGCILMGADDPLTGPKYVKVKDAPKNSQKTINEMGAALETAKDAIAWLFNQRDWTRLYAAVRNIALYGYTEQFRKQMEELMNKNTNNQNNSEDEVMTNETMKVADLIGKSISNGGNAKYTINAIEGDKVSVTFQMGDSEGKPMTMGVAQVEKLLAGGWTVSDGTQEPTEKKADGGSQKAEEPKAKTVKMEKPKQEKPKEEKPETCNVKPETCNVKPETSNVKPETKAGKLTYATYTNSKGKACAKISGFAETDAAYQKDAAVSLHGSATYENTKQGRVNFLLFGPRYAEVAKTVCQMLNEGKTVADCQAVVDAATEERAQKREERKERKQKREAYRQEHEGRNHQPSDTIARHTQTFRSENHQTSSGKTYTEQEVADLMRRVIAGDKEAMAIVNAMAA